MDSKGTSIPGATIQLNDTDGKAVAQVSTDQKGIFVLEGLTAAGQYRIKVSMVGYAPYETAAKEIKSGESNSMLIRLEEQSSALDEVVVVG